MAVRQRDRISRWRSAINAWSLSSALTLGLATVCFGHSNLWPEPSRVGNTAPDTQLNVGALKLNRCNVARAWCGRLERPLDPSGAVPGTISIYFEFYRHAGDPRAEGTLVATEGGPGYPATQSRNDYLALFKPLMKQRDVVIMDNRGTGQSGAVDCRALQTGEKWTVASVAQCGKSLGSRASLYSSAYAADDLAAILTALGIDKIDLYGDSYGTYFEQIFAIRHPAVVRTMVLDGAYPLSGEDYAWYPSYAPAMRDKFNVACQRSASCSALPGTSIEHIKPALEALRARPYRARAADVDGKLRTFRADAAQLAIVMYGGAPALTTARETDAAARAWVLGDRTPMLRLMAETASAVDSRDAAAQPTRWSAGLAAAVMCQDPPQIFDMRLPPIERARDRDRALRERRRQLPETYAPFTIDEYRAMPLDYSFLDECVAWPVAPAAHRAAELGMNAVYPDIPALIISGELDNITTLADGAAVTAAFKQGTQIRLANSFHVNALPRARSSCAAQIARRFLATGVTGDTSCASAVVPLRLVAKFALHAGDLEPAMALPGNEADAAKLRMVSAAVMTAGDLVVRVNANSSGKGYGLRGGSFEITARGDDPTIHLHGVRWVEDVAVSGAVERSGGRQGVVRAVLHVTSAAGAGHLQVSWPEGLPAAQAQITGTLAGSRVVAESPAP